MTNLTISELEKELKFLTDRKAKLMKIYNPLNSDVLNEVTRENIIGLNDILAKVNYELSYKKTFN